MLGSEGGHVEVVDKLLQHGARVDLQSKVCMSFDCECRDSNLTQSTFKVLFYGHM